MGEICVVTAIVALTGIALAQLVFIWKRMPRPDSEAIDLAALRQQAAFNKGFQYHRQIATDQQTAEQDTAIGLQYRYGTEPVIPSPAPPAQEEIPDEESVELTMQC